MRWIDSSCRLWLRMFSSSSLTRRYWNSSSSGMLKLHSVRQQFRCTWVKGKQALGQGYMKTWTPSPQVSLLLGAETILMTTTDVSVPSRVALCFSRALSGTLFPLPVTPVSQEHTLTFQASLFLPACKLSAAVTILQPSGISSASFQCRALAPRVSHTPFDHYRQTKRTLLQLSSPCSGEHPMDEEHPVCNPHH